jgi:arylsulfatase A-like enzyme
MKNLRNLLLLWTDQQRADTMACYGNDQIETPHLNRLSEESFVFRNAYCTQPVCTPSRASILTGLWPHTHGCVSNNVALPKEVKTIAEILPPQYRCGYYGKWHLGDEIVPQRGFDDWVSTEDESYRPYFSKPELLERRSDYHHFLVKSGFYPDREAADGARIFSRPFAAGMAEVFTKAAFLGREAARFLRSQSGNRPFCLSVNFLEPHPPMFGPLNHLYDPDTLPVGEAFLKAPPKKAATRLRCAHTRKMSEGVKIIKFMHYPLKTEWDWRRVMANYYGLVTLVDRAVGEILKALEDSGQAENTVVAYTSDHGEMLGDHQLLGKGVFFEPSVRIPLLVRAPWLSGGPRMIDGRFSQIDLLPTLLDLLGQRIPDGLQGCSRCPVLTGRESLAEYDVVV